MSEDSSVVNMGNITGPLSVTSPQGLNATSGGQPLGGPSGPPSGGVPFNADAHQLAKSIELYGIPVCLVIGLIGTILAFMTLLRRNVRGYSSAVYLLMMFVFDMVYMAGDGLADFIMALRPDGALNTTLCEVLQGVKVIGREGTCFIITMLILERVMLLASPKRFYGLASVKMALLITSVITMVTVGLSGFEIATIQYNTQAGRCTFRTGHPVLPDKIAINIRLSIIGSSLALQFILSILLGVFLFKKAQIRQNDPIQNSISAARKQTSQLNRINLICFFMTIQFMLVNIPQLTGPAIYWKASREKRLDRGSIALIAITITFSSLLLIAFRFFFMIIASPKLRDECWKAIRCVGETSLSQQMAAKIDPKQKKSSDDVFPPPPPLHEK